MAKFNLMWRMPIDCGVPRSCVQDENGDDAIERIGGPDSEAFAKRLVDLLNAADGSQAMADEYRRWLDFYHAGNGDFADFLRTVSPP